MSKTQQNSNESVQAVYGVTTMGTSSLSDDETKRLTALVHEHGTAGFLPYVYIQDSISFARPLTLKQFQEMVMNFDSKRFQVAKQVTRSLKKDISYLELYLKFAQGIINKEEFKIEAKKFLVTPRHISKEEFQIEAHTVMELLDCESIDAQELSDLLGTELMETDSRLRSDEDSLILA